MEYEYDFSGWATRNDLKCADGRTIRHNAFKECDGMEVPLVWNHSHGEPENVLGHALLQNKDNGVYCYGTFNDTSAGQVAKVLVEHGDIKALSIYANQLKEVAGDVIHGIIREVSLVHAGANPGAYIDTIIAHSEDADEEAIIYTGEEISLTHSDMDEDDEVDEEEIEEVEETEEEVIEHSSESEEKSDKGDTKMAERTVEDVINSMNEEQQSVMYALIDEALKSGDDDKEENTEMKHNVFEDDNRDEVLIHDGLNEILKDGRKFGSLKESYLAHAAEYGIENMDFINTEDKDIYDRPQWINTQPTGWVQAVMSGVHNTPFANVRMQFADITEDEARAKGYTKGKYKKEEVFKLLKRTVGPTTIYKKQKFDRDDLIDADFDVIPWVKEEMNIKFDEEKARAYLFGDGRSSADEDKINESCIIPIVSDEDLFTIKVTVTPEQNESLEHAIITAAVLSQDDYQGSGNTIAFMEAKKVSKMLLMEDQFGHRLYKNISELADAMGVGRIIKVPAGVCPTGFYGLIVDLADYNVGMKNAGKTNFFDDFDIDYNQQKYLMETRQSGALTRPYSAIVLKAAQG